MGNVNSIYEPKERPMGVFALFSGGASGVRYLLEEGESDKYEIVGGLTDHPSATGTAEFKRHDIPVAVKEYSGGDYYKEVLQEVRNLDTDLIMLSGFMKIVEEPLLSEFENRIINVHPADLTIEEEGERKYKGDDAVYDAITSGKEELRPTVHIATEDFDEGPILVLSKGFPVDTESIETLKEWSDEKTLRKYAEVIQERMKWEGDGPALNKALELFSEGRVGERDSKILLEEGGEFKPSYYDLGNDKIIETA